MDRSALRAIFPKTLDILQDHQLGLLPDQFGRTVCEELAIPASQDSSLWFPVFLKVQGVSRDILEVAEFEYLRHSVLQDDDDGKTTIAEPLRSGLPIGLNPTVQFVELHHDQPRLSRRSGLYCFLKTNGQFLEFQLGLEQALAVDILHEERAFTSEQLAEMANLHSLGRKQSVTEWHDQILHMLSIGLLQYKRPQKAAEVSHANSKF